MQKENARKKQIRFLAVIILIVIAYGIINPERIYTFEELDFLKISTAVTAAIVVGIWFLVQTFMLAEKLLELRRLKKMQRREGYLEGRENRITELQTEWPHTFVKFSVFTFLSTYIYPLCREVVWIPETWWFLCLMLLIFGSYSLRKASYLDKWDIFMRPWLSWVVTLVVTIILFLSCIRNFTGSRKWDKMVTDIPFSPEQALSLIIIETEYYHFLIMTMVVIAGLIVVCKHWQLAMEK
jgi:hypothetical protein